jgi:predicted nucleic acid-binding protein
LASGNKDAVAKAQTLEANPVQQRLSAVSLFELYYGVARATDSAAERSTVGEVVASKPVHPVDTAVIRKAGRLARLGQRPRRSGVIGQPIDER